MKAIRTILIFLLISTAAIAQAPQSIHYQAVARDNSNNIITNQAISLRFTIRQGTSGGFIIYQETQSTTTNSLGLFTVNIGEGSVISGAFTSINWGSGAKFLQTELDVTGGSSFTDMGAEQLLSVPYALHANTSGSSDNWGSQVVVTNATITGDGTGGNPLTIAQQNATTGQVLKWNGISWVPSTDANNGGTVTSITAGTGLSGGTITTSGTISLPTVGPTGTFGSSTQIPVITLDGRGRVSAVTTSTPSSGWSLSGNAGTNTGNFIGTTDQQSLRFKTNNSNSGIINYDFPRNTSLGFQALNNPSLFGVDNTAMGFMAMQNSTTGVLNVAVGAYAMQSNTDGTYNTAVGGYALTKITIGSGNTALGYLTLNEDTTGSNNTAVGYYALSENTNGENNTAVGSGALYVNTTGSENVSMGDNSLANATNANQNTAVGTRTMFETMGGSENTALGYTALNKTTSGTKNTGAGTRALFFNNIGTNNTALGYNALSANTLGNSNTAVGYEANVSNGAFTNATAIGANAIVGSSDAVVLGNNANVGIKTSNPKSTLDVIGAMGLKVMTSQVAGTNNPDNTAGIWIYSSGSGAIILPTAVTVSNRMYVIINQTGTTRSITSYRDLSGVSQSTIAASTSIWLVADGSLWWQVK